MPEIRQDGYMAQIIGIASQKGGVGKSTLARMLAVGYAANDWDVLIADLDTKQATALDWTRRRAGGDILPSIQAMAFPTVAAALKIAGKHDLVIFDMPPHSSSGTAELAKAADVMFIPTGTTVDDLIPTVRLMHELVKAGMTASRIAAIMVKGIDSEAQTEAAYTFVTEAGYKCLLPALPLKPTYASALDYAKSPTEVTHPKARARAEACLQAAIDFVATHNKE
jgi:chromosome partitioning protein